MCFSQDEAHAVKNRSAARTQRLNKCGHLTWPMMVLMQNFLPLKTAYLSTVKAKYVLL
jgi:hypothetical protein